MQYQATGPPSQDSWARDSSLPQDDLKTFRVKRAPTVRRMRTAAFQINNLCTRLRPELSWLSCEKSNNIL
jgi:hypothetical protein